MEKLEFSTNWNNKLDCKCFTTIRIYNPMKHLNGNKFDVLFKTNFRYKVQVISLGLYFLHELTDYICYLDTGYSKLETIEIFRKMYPKTDFKNTRLVVMLLKKIDPPKPKQTELFNQ